MKLNLLLMALGTLLIAGITSCSKDKAANPNTPADPVNEKLLMATNEYYSSSTFQYYPDRKIKQYCYIAGASTYRYDYTYNGNTVSQIMFYNNTKSSENIFTLNSKGYATTCQYIEYDANGNPNGYQSITNYTYNAAGQVVKETYSTGGYSEYFYDANGNRIEFDAYNTSNQKYWVSQYEFYTDKFAKHLSYGQFDSNGFGQFLPLPAKNLVKHQVSTNLLTNTVDFDGQYSYTLDKDGFIMTGQWVNAVSGQTYNWTNTFQ